jgi:parallel beta-helix repeat protein
LCALALVIGSVFAISPASAASNTLWVNDDSGPWLPTGNSCEHPQFATIQSAVGAATPGARINVCAGTYVEQVTIPAGKNGLYLRSVGHWQAVIKAPPLMADPKAIVRVNGARDVTLLAFTIAGPGGGPCDSIRYGVRVDANGSADILGNHIIDIRDTGFSGCQNGLAVQVGRQFEGQTGSARIIGNVIERYQKNGPTVDNVGSFAEIAHNRILGVGPTPFIAQNGMQISRGATALVQHNFVSQNVYTGTQPAASTGILLFDSGIVRTIHNSVSVNDVGVYLILAGAGSVTTNNRVRASTFDGIALDTSGHEVANNKSDANSGPGVGLYFSDGNTVHNNQVQDNADSGILVYASSNNAISNNHIRDNGTAAGDTTDGIRVEPGSTGNTISDNHLRHNLAHDCHDNFIGNTWSNNHGETSVPEGICGGGSSTVITSATFGWDANYAWYAGVEGAAGYDWAAAYGTVDTDGLLQLLPLTTVRVRPVPVPQQ